MNRELLTSKIVRKIIGQIAAGIYPEGERLPAERKLCADLGVSRGTLRKALFELEKIGAVEIKHGSGIYVRKISAKKIPDEVLPPDFRTVKIDDIIDARKAIENAAVAQACQKVTSRQVAKIGAVVTEMERKLDDLAGFIEQDMLFHELIVNASSNAVLVKAFEAISEYHRYCQIFTSSSEECETKALDYHKKIHAALKDRDSRLAVDLMTKHLEEMKDISQIR